jgi:hypothetical protein
MCNRCGNIQFPEYVATLVTVKNILLLPKIFYALVPKIKYDNSDFCCQQLIFLCKLPIAKE